MTISYDGNIVAGTIIKLKNESVKSILKTNFNDCIFHTYKITDEYIKLMFDQFELRKALHSLSMNSTKYEVKDTTIFIRLNENASIPELDGDKVVDTTKEDVESEKVETKSDTDKSIKDETKPEKVEESPAEVNPVIELVVAPGDALEKLDPGEYKIIFNGINFAILSQGDDRNYIKEEKVITITDQFKKLTGVSTKKKKNK